MSINRVKRKGGTVRWEVRWYEGGRDSARRKRTFDTKKDAQFFESTLRRGKQLGQLAPELLGSSQTLEQFSNEWWEKYAVPQLKPGTLADYALKIDKWLIPYLGTTPLRDINRELIDGWKATLLDDGAGRSSVNKTQAILQGILNRAVEWKRLPHNPVVGAAKLPVQRDPGIDARTPEEVETIRAVLDTLDATLVSILAYEGLRPSEAYALRWIDVLTRDHQPRERLLVNKGLSDGQLTLTKTGRRREPELFAPVGDDLLSLYLEHDLPALDSLVFPNSDGGFIQHQNWRNRIWKPALETAGLDYFRPYDLRHTCATLLIYSGWTVNEVADHLGHADPGFTARTYAHPFKDARKRRGIPIEDAIHSARLTEASPARTSADQRDVEAKTG